MKPSKKQKDSPVTDESLASVRALISVPPDIYHTLEQIASQKKVSLALVVRDAAEQYIAEKRPFLRKSAP